MATVNALTTCVEVVPPTNMWGAGGDHLHRRTLWHVFSTETIASTTNTIISVGSGFTGIFIGEYNTFGVYATLAGTSPSVTIALVQSYNDTSANYVSPNTNATIVTSLTSTTSQIYAINPTPMPLIRFTAVGTGANGTDTTLDLWFWMQRS